MPIVVAAAHSARHGKCIALSAAPRRGVVLRSRGGAPSRQRQRAPLPRRKSLHGPLAEARAVQRRHAAALQLCGVGLARSAASAFLASVHLDRSAGNACHVTCEANMRFTWWYRPSVSSTCAACGSPATLRSSAGAHGDPSKMMLPFANAAAAPAGSGVSNTALYSFGTCSSAAMAPGWLSATYTLFA